MWRMNSPAQRQGKHYEHLAWRYLQQAGLVLEAKNFRCRCGEIDLICRDGEALVFIEVRYRKANKYGSAAATVTYKKQQKLLRVARQYLQTRGLFDKIPCRFDVVGISPCETTKYSIEWIKNAFT